MPTLCFSENPSAHKGVVFANLPANLAVRRAGMMLLEADSFKTKIMFRFEALNHQQAGAVPAAECKINGSKHTLEQQITVAHYKSCSAAASDLRNCIERQSGQRRKVMSRAC